MSTQVNVHQVFARYFKDPTIEPYLFELSRMLAEGHICYDPTLIDVEELKQAGYDQLPDLNALTKSPLISDGNQHTPFVLINNNLYMQRYYYYESLVLERIKEFILEENKTRSERFKKILDLKEIIAGLFGSKHMQQGPVDWQLMAALTAVLHDFSIITGGPGTGKTTTVAKVLALLLHMNRALKIALCAPTGKAAARMAESLRYAGKDSAPFIKDVFEALKPATIHRLLGSSEHNVRFKHNRENPLLADIVIVDEASMIDVALMAKLMDAIGQGTKLILLGDKDQLASVEAGSLFGDLCKALPVLNEFSNGYLDDLKSLLPEGTILPARGDNRGANHLLYEHIVELKYSHRFSDQKGIGKLSKAILNNQPDKIAGFFDNLDEEVKIDSSYDKRLFEDFVMGYLDFIKEKDIKVALKKINQLRVLAAVRETAQGVHAINAAIEKILKQKAGLKPYSIFYENRPIMVTSNNHQLGLFNGDIGIIRAAEDGIMRAWFEAADGSLKSVLPGFINSMETAFAMTIHKSQGSEFNQVMILLPEKKQAERMMTRELLYTAVTRAKEKVIIQGSQEAILSAAAIGIHRGSGVIKRLCK
ncbi:DNA helicase/exodeoxyribonuclease V, alpha subunit [Arachidicoccus rhizosphaerae]|uniref:RecBCD enzyme subunit RecD n=1 Tax=Arachidicoccus rhizosphaerae TaxID=551991 RepID=A0A1H3YXL6_9BACT|nr:exodeoxyribonuclease V subunit alpha [Arachidicoccus rhizosphaerae]SEA16206.1 DNA helicase/exodeoxyribonuclease V, alpha subunit [Arachidicoccus rhizosphaerae]